MKVSPMIAGGIRGVEARMSDDKMRSEFEAWAGAHFVEPNLKRYPLGHPRYCEDEMQIAYEAFHAGMQAAQRQGGEAVAWDSEAVDPAVTKLYRKFREWNQRGFTEDDVTWCEVRAYVAEMLSAAPQPQPAVPETGWKPIDQAPTDGTMVDLWSCGERRTHCVWGKPTYGSGPCWVALNEGYDSNGPVDEPVKTPTHFMHAPEPPEDT